MKFRLAAVLLLGAVVAAALGASLVAVETAPSATGSVHGHVLTLVGPAVGYRIAPFTAVVEVETSGHIVTTDRVPPGDQFHLTAPAGTYTIEVAGHSGYRSCSRQMTFVAHKDRKTEVTCGRSTAG